ncbi:MAG TPA: ZIP family metal transporter [Polyangia bacterium]|nr:ZIP family metal transporter [Polyangia bacterium]
MLVALVAALASGLATGLGVLPLLLTPKLPRRLYDGILATGAGLMLSAATLGLLGHALEPPIDGTRLFQVVLGLGAGAALIVAADRLVPHLHAAGHPHDAAHEHVRRGFLLTGAMALHRLPEGFAVGAAFAASGGVARGLGMLLALAVGFQNVCEGLVMAAPLLHGGMRRPRVVGVVTLTGLPVPAAAAVGYLFSAELGAALPAVLALAAGALITLTSNEIIPETHGHGGEVPATIGIVTGFGVTIVLRATLGH